MALCEELDNKYERKFLVLTITCFYNLKYYARMLYIYTLHNIIYFAFPIDRCRFHAIYLVE